MNDAEVIVIGGGISGLSCARKLQQRGINFLLLDSSSRLGGVIRSERVKGYLCEHGPNTLMISKAESIQFLEDIGALNSAIDAAPDASNRFILQDSEVRPLPKSFWQFITSNTLSTGSKCRLLQEMFISRGSYPEESIASFVERRFGKEVLSEFVGPFVSGIYAGDPNRLLIRHCLPRLYQYEHKFGSISVGTLILMLKRTSQNNVRSKMISWAGGLQDLVSIISNSFLDRIRSNTEVEEIHEKDGGYEIVSKTGTYRAREVVVATTSGRAANILRPLSNQAASLDNLPYAPIAVAHLGFNLSDVGHSLNGFGVLISRERKLRTLGALFSSSLFPGRSPTGKVLLTCFMGGSLDPTALDLSDDELTRTVFDELKGPLDLKSDPEFRNVLRWSKAIPQYESGYDTVLQCRDMLQERLPGLYLIGSYLQGVSLQDCMLHGLTVGEKVAKSPSNA